MDPESYFNDLWYIKNLLLTIRWAGTIWAPSEYCITDLSTFLGSVPITLAPIPRNVEVAGGSTFDLPSAPVYTWIESTTGIVFTTLD